MENDEKQISQIPDGYYLDNSQVLTPEGIINKNELKVLPKDVNMLNIDNL